MDLQMPELRLDHRFPVEEEVPLDEAGRQEQRGDSACDGCQRETRAAPMPEHISPGETKIGQERVHEADRTATRPCAPRRKSGSRAPLVRCRPPATAGSCDNRPP